MQTNKSKYDAIITHARMNNNIKLQTIKEIVEEVVINNEEPIRKCDLDNIVSGKINLPIDASIKSTVSNSLIYLFKERIVKPADTRGYWEKH